MVVSALLSACTAADSDPVPPVPVVMAAEPSCPTLQGQDCRGKLAPGTYTTRAFTPTLTYTVPDGWSNRQDRSGNFVLLARVSRQSVSTRARASTSLRSRPS